MPSHTPLVPSTSQIRDQRLESFTPGLDDCPAWFLAQGERTLDAVEANALRGAIAHRQCAGARARLVDAPEVDERVHGADFGHVPGTIWIRARSRRRSMSLHSSNAASDAFEVPRR